MTDAEYVDNADVVFAGALLDREEPPAGEIVSSGDLVTLTFAVSEVYKGQVGTTAQVRTAISGASCGLELDGEGPFLVFTQFGDDGLTASLCGGTRDLPETVPAVLGEGRPPAGSGGTEAVTHEESMSGIDGGTPMAVWLTGGAAVALIALLSYGMYRRRKAE
ncbi:MAG: hypothetical protein GEU97_24645 [Actinophytocola sp.]|nr:hypothetical protein [Actinophytocola sp.]